MSANADESDTTSTLYLSSGVPIDSYGSIGDYAVVSTSSANPIYYKGYDNAWKLVGSDSWKSVVPTVTGNIASPTVTSGAKMIIMSWLQNSGGCNPSYQTLTPTTLLPPECCESGFVGPQILCDQYYGPHAENGLKIGQK